MLLEPHRPGGGVLDVDDGGEALELVGVARLVRHADGLAELPGGASRRRRIAARVVRVVDRLRHLRLTGVVRELVVHPGRLRLVVGPDRADPRLGDDGVVDDELDPSGEHLVADLARRAPRSTRGSRDSRRTTRRWGSRPRDRRRRPAVRSGPRSSGSPVARGRRARPPASRRAGRRCRCRRAIARSIVAVKSAARSSGLTDRLDRAEQRRRDRCGAPLTTQSAPTPRQSHWKLPSHSASASASSSGDSFWFSPSVRRIAWLMQVGAVRDQVVRRRQPVADRGATAGLELPHRVLGVLPGGRRRGHELVPVGVHVARVVVARDHPNSTSSRMQSIAAQVAATADLILVRGKFIEPETSTMTSSADSRPRGGGAGPGGGHADERVDPRGAGGEELVLIRLGGEGRHGPSGGAVTGDGTTSTTTTVMLSRPAGGQRDTRQRPGDVDRRRRRGVRAHQRGHAVRGGRVVPQPVGAEHEPAGRRRHEGGDSGRAAGRVLAQPACDRVRVAVALRFVLAQPAAVDLLLHPRVVDGELLDGVGRRPSRRGSRRPHRW